MSKSNYTPEHFELPLKPEAPIIVEPSDLHEALARTCIPGLVAIMFEQPSDEPFNRGTLQEKGLNIEEAFAERLGIDKTITGGFHRYTKISTGVERIFEEYQYRQGPGRLTLLVCGLEVPTPEVIGARLTLDNFPVLGHTTESISGTFIYFGEQIKVKDESGSIRTADALRRTPIEKIEKKPSPHIEAQPKTGKAVHSRLTPYGGNKQKLTVIGQLDRHS